jgi:acyl carrier protein
MSTSSDASDRILEHVIGVLQEVTAEWDVEPISADTRLGGLGLESINLVYFIAEIQQYYGLQGRLLAGLTASRRLLTDWRVSEVVALVEQSSSTLRAGETEGGEA